MISRYSAFLNGLVLVENVLNRAFQIKSYYHTALSLERDLSRKTHKFGSSTGHVGARNDCIRRLLMKYHFHSSLNIAGILAGCLLTAPISMGVGCIVSFALAGISQGATFWDLVHEAQDCYDDPGDSDHNDEEKSEEGNCSPQE